MSRSTAMFFALFLVVLSAASGASAASDPKPTLTAAKPTAPGGDAPVNTKFVLPETLRVGVYSTEGFYNANGTGFEASLLNDICKQLKVTCNVTILDTLEERITDLQDKSADLTLGQFSVTPERALNVSFVHPYYYSAGGAIFSTDANIPTINSKGWPVLNGKTICFLTDYYAEPELAAMYSFTPVFVPDTTTGASKVQAGDCYAFVDDNTQATMIELIMADLPLQSSEPYAFAVANGNDDLRLLIAGAMVRNMAEGQASPVLKYEQEFLVAEGIPKNADLNTTVTAISEFVGVSESNDTPSSAATTRGMVAGVFGVAIVALFA